MNSEKVKEILGRLHCKLLGDRRNEINYEEINCVGEVITLINELEKRNTDLLNDLENIDTRLQNTCDICETELKQFSEMLKEKLEESNFMNDGLWLVDTQVLIAETLKDCLNKRLVLK